MYTLVGVQKLSETQKSRLRNGHPVRIKKGSGNQLHLTNEQIKKLESAAKKGAAYTLTLHPEQAEKHGSGFFGDIASKAKKFAISTIKANRDLINPIIGRARSYAKSGIQKLADKANSQVDKYTPEIEGEGIIGDALKGLIGMTGLGMKKRGRPKKILTEVVNNQVRVRKGKGVLSNIIKAVAPAVIDAAAGAVKNKVETIGSGVAHKKILGQGIKKVAKKPRKRKGGALFPAGNYGPRD
jgi:hypothetical protein